MAGKVLFIIVAYTGLFNGVSLMQRRAYNPSLMMNYMLSQGAIPNVKN
jgi:hypothetical protein